MFERLHTWLHRLVVSVPGEIAACEFDCHVLNCRQGDWVHCKRRIRAAEQADPVGQKEKESR